MKMRFPAESVYGKLEEIRTKLKWHVRRDEKLLSLKTEASRHFRPWESCRLLERPWHKSILHSASALSDSDMHRVYDVTTVSLNRAPSAFSRRQTDARNWKAAVSLCRIDCARAAQ